MRYECLCYCYTADVLAVLTLVPVGRCVCVCVPVTLTVVTDVFPVVTLTANNAATTVVGFCRFLFVTSVTDIFS